MYNNKMNSKNKENDIIAQENIRNLIRFYSRIYLA